MKDYSELVLLVKKNTKEYMNATLKQDWKGAKQFAKDLIHNSILLSESTPAK